METTDKLFPTFLKLGADFVGLVGILFCILYVFSIVLGMGSESSYPGEFLSWGIRNYVILIIAALATIYFIWFRKTEK